MKFNRLKRDFFFWIEKLQISRTERIAFTVLLVVLAVSFLLHGLLKRSYNYSQEQYDEIAAEFEKRSTVLHQQQKETSAKYNPDTTVIDTPEPVAEPLAEMPEPNVAGAVQIININTAGAADLQRLDGIGPAYAQRIIEYRETNGGFDSIEELLNVKGIGKKRLENIRPFITLEE